MRDLSSSGEEEEEIGILKMYAYWLTMFKWRDLVYQSKPDI